MNAARNKTKNSINSQEQLSHLNQNHYSCSYSKHEQQMQLTWH